MPPHRSSAAGPRRGRRRGAARGDDRPLDQDWLEKRALPYRARGESTERGVTELLERKVRRRCERTGESPEPALELVPELVSRLAARGFVDDRRFATGALDRLRRQGRSRAQIRGRLRAKGIDSTLLDELLGDEEAGDELRAGWRLARRRRLGPYCPDPEQRRERRRAHLAVLGRQGFDFETARRIIDAPAPPEPD